jgi:hypothetical protein
MDDREWRLNLPEGPMPLPTIAYVYAYAGYYRDQYNKGQSSIERVVVEFDEGNGWQEYDIVTFKRSS